MTQREPVVALRRGRRRRNDTGASAVEFALILVPFLVILFGIIQYGFYFYSSQAGASAAREAARQLSVGDCTNPTELQDFVKAKLGGASLNLIQAAHTYAKPDGTATTSPSIGDTVTVKIRFQALDLNFPFVPVFDDGKVSREVGARVEDLDSSGVCA